MPSDAWFTLPGVQPPGQPTRRESEMRILLATPTRGRPEAFREMVKTARSTASDNSNISIVARIDHDDPERAGYLTERGYTVIQGERVTLPVAWNEMADECRFDILMMCADDIRFRTTKWDDEVRAAFEQWPDRIGHAYGNDGFQGEKLATHSFVSKEWIEAVGYYLPPILKGDYVDTFLQVLGRELGRSHYMPLVYTEHLHPFAGKAEMDDTYAYRHTGTGPALQKAAWDQLVHSGEIQRAYERLRGVMS